MGDVVETEIEGLGRQRNVVVAEAETATRSSYGGLAKGKGEDTMDFTLSEEQLAIRETCRDFAEQEIKPEASQLDATGRFPYELIQEMGEAWLAWFTVPRGVRKTLVGPMFTVVSRVTDHSTVSDQHALAICRSIVSHLNCRTYVPWEIHPPEPPRYDPQELYGIIPWGQSQEKL